GGIRAFGQFPDQGVEWRVQDGIMTNMGRQLQLFGLQVLDKTARFGLFVEIFALQDAFYQVIVTSELLFISGVLAESDRRKEVHVLFYEIVALLLLLRNILVRKGGQV